MPDIEWSPEAIEDAEALPDEAQDELRKLLAEVKEKGIGALIERSRPLSAEESDALMARVEARRAEREQQRRN